MKDFLDDNSEYTHADEVIELIDDMLNGLIENDDGDPVDFEFASDTLEGIKDTINRTKTTTEGQEAAIRNIKEGGLRASNNNNTGRDYNEEIW